ncbi:hypothetical protein E4V99_12690 [Microbacterium sp. dk485]|uniref:hypothetical protein n=1 Tax=Microbacterium sp. dk485 TaxID=2560021 RepID=UPI0010742C6B|nr:hypothetical protein [Microbacterium sp. dk485]TFV81812.1 hypothetical protein E4V99_12690 [Microbacterium sp. dk485]
MSDPRRRPINAGTLSMSPSEAPERWNVHAGGEGEPTVAASWGDWVRLARRILDADALSRDLEARGDAWDRGHAASGEDAVNPYR